MTISSERARLVLERYKAVTTPASGDKARLLEIIQQRGRRGDFPQFYIQASAPVAPRATPLQTLWRSSLGKAGLVLAVTGLPAIGLYDSQKTRRGPPVLEVGSSASRPPSLPSTEASQPRGDESASSTADPASRAGLDSPRSVASGALTIDEEVRLMNGAQAALRSGDPKRALQLLGEHARRFPNGKLANARMVTRMSALCTMGLSDEARREADRFLARNPNSPFSERVRNVCVPESEENQETISRSPNDK
jgi:hypothetical protein